MRQDNNWRNGEDQYAWKHGSIGRITNATLAMSTNLNPKARNKNTTSREKIGKSDLPEQEKEFLLAHPDVYVDFDIPWSMNIGYNLSYVRPINRSADVTQTVNFSGDVSISEKWKVTYSSGYHFESGEFTQTNLGITRDIALLDDECQLDAFWKISTILFYH